MLVFYDVSCGRVMNARPTIIVVCGHAFHGLSGTQVASTLLATVGQLLLHAAALQENVSQLQVFRNHDEPIGKKRPKLA